MPTDTDPSLIHTITTDALPEPGECECDPSHPETAADRLIHDQSRRIAGLEFTNHRLRLDVGNLKVGKANAEDAWRDECMKVRGLEHAMDDLKAELANRDETIAVRDSTLADLEETNDRQHEVLEAERSISSGLSTACCKLKVELAGRDKEIASLKATLAASKETNDLSAKVRNLHANLADAHRELALLKDELAETKQRLSGFVDATMTERRLVEKRDATITSLRTHLARAEAIEAKAKKVLATWVQCGPNAPVFKSSLKELASELDPPASPASPSPGHEAEIEQLKAGLAEWLPQDPPHISFKCHPAPEPPEANCPHCGTTFGPKNLTCGECGRWLDNPAAKPAETRLAILERVAHATQAILRMAERSSGGPYIELYLGPEIRGLRLALAALEQLEATPCPSR